MRTFISLFDVGAIQFQPKESLRAIDLPDWRFITWLWPQFDNETFVSNREVILRNVLHNSSMIKAFFYADSDGTQQGITMSYSGLTLD